MADRALADSTSFLSVLKAKLAALTATTALAGKSLVLSNGERVSIDTLAAYLGSGSPSSPSISISNAVSQPEGNSNTTTFSYTVTLTRNGNTSALPFTWSVAGSGSNPANAADFGGSFPSGSGTFAAGETSKTIQVLASGDAVVEPDEAFTLTVTLTGYNTVTAQGTIVNDDSTSVQLPSGVVFRAMSFDQAAQADNSDLNAIADAANALSLTPQGGIKAKYRTAGLNGKAYVQVPAGAVYSVDPTGGAAGTALKNQDFTVVHFMHGIANTSRAQGAVFSRFHNGNYIWHQANGVRLCLSGQIGGEDNTIQGAFGLPYADAGFACFAHTSATAHPFNGGTTGLQRVYINGGCVRSTNNPNNNTDDGYKMSLFGVLDNSGAIFDAGSYQGNWYGTLIFNRALTPAEVKQVTAWGYQQVGLTAPQTALVGWSDSLINGYGGDAAEYGPIAVAAATLGLAPGEWDNLGISGINEDSLTAIAATDLYPIASWTTASLKIICGEFHNQMLSRTASQAAAKTQAMVQAIRSNLPSAKIIVQTPSTSGQVSAANQNIYTNALVSGASGWGANAVARIDQDANIGVGASFSNVTYFQSDQLHLTGKAGVSGYRAKGAVLAAAYQGV